jgi:ParB/RepB/Spo0J family partition protein
MAGPKRLGGGGAIAVPDRTATIAAAGQALAEAEEYVGELVYEMVRVSQLDPDPTNPRNYHWINTNDPAATMLREDQEKERAEFESLCNMAETIRVGGLRMAIEAFRKADGRLQIVHGHRRYWAARIAGVIEVKVHLVKESEARNEASQWVENAHREDLPLAGRLLSFSKAVAALERAEYPQDKILAMLGLGARQFRRYRLVSSAPSDIQEAITDGLLNDLCVAERLCNIQEPAERAVALKHALAGTMPPEPVRKPATPRPGRPVTTVKTKPIRQTGVVRIIIEKIAPESASAIDWEDMVQVAKAWQGFLDALEKQVKGKQK